MVRLEKFNSKAARETIQQILLDRGRSGRVLARFGKYMEQWKVPTLEKFRAFLEQEAIESVGRAAASRPIPESFASVLDEVGFGSGANMSQNLAHLLEAISRDRKNRLAMRDTIGELKPEFRLQDGVDELKYMIDEILKHKARAERL